MRIRVKDTNRFVITSCADQLVNGEDRVGRQLLFSPSGCDLTKLAQCIDKSITASTYLM